MSDLRKSLQKFADCPHLYWQCQECKCVTTLRALETYNLNECNDCGFRWDAIHGKQCASCDCDELRGMLLDREDKG